MSPPRTLLRAVCCLAMLMFLVSCRAPESARPVSLAPPPVHNYTQDLETDSDVEALPLQNASQSRRLPRAK